MGSPLAWVLFNVVILALLALDLGVFHRRAHAVSIREAAGWSAFWVALSLLFNLGIYLLVGRDEALEFLTGYLIEKSLAVDNLFVFVLIFSYFGVPAAYQHRVLFWGILGALVMRAAFILAGSYMLQHYDWVFYVFGALLVITGIRMAVRDEDAIDPSQSRVLRIARKVLPVTVGFRGTHFFVRENGRILATPLLLVLILIEFSDLIFAVDSIPAIFAITLDPFIVYTSNVFAILGLRSMYFLLAGIIHRFVYLRYALAFVLVFVGVKMLLEDVVHIPILVSLGVIAAALVVGVLVSLRASEEQREDVLPEPPPVPGEPLAEAAEPGADSLPGGDERDSHG
ncbi:MAG TPA: TerC family protein [Rhodothermales bacterium]